MVRAKKLILKKKFEDFPKETDFEIVEEELPPLEDGEFLAKALYISLDPFMRAYAFTHPLNYVFHCDQLAQVIESRNSNYPVGTQVVGRFGCSTHIISTGKSKLTIIWKVPDFEFPVSYALGILGMPGNTAYFGLLEICKPQSDETVVVTGAAGAVGSIVGQIAKIKGCTVIGITGSAEKEQWLKGLNFDYVLNHKDEKFKEKLSIITPNGVDCFFDNIGGEINPIVIARMNKFGRISICGGSAAYNKTNPDKVTPIYRYVIGRQLKIEGFIVSRWYDRWFEGINQLHTWMKEGKLKYHETITEGFENIFPAFINMLEGKNKGKNLLKI